MNSQTVQPNADATRADYDPVHKLYFQGALEVRSSGRRWVVIRKTTGSALATFDNADAAYLWVTDHSVQATPLQHRYP